jgi:hypothetical protein
MKQIIEKLYIGLFIIMVFPACSLNKNIGRESPNFAKKYEKLKTITIVPVEISIYETHADGSNNKNENWSNSAKENLVKSIENELEESNISIDRFNETNISKENKIKLRETHIRYKAVEESILNQTVPGRPEFNQERLSNFDYSLEFEIKRLNEETDAFLLVRAFAQIDTEGRKVLKNITAITGGVLLDVFTGGMVNNAFLFGHPTGEYAFLSIALVDSNSGDVLWYNFEFSKKKTTYNLLNAESAQKMVDKVLSNLEEE